MRPVENSLLNTGIVKSFGMSLLGSLSLQNSFNAITNSNNTHQTCNSLSIAPPSLFGAAIISLDAFPVIGYSQPITGDDTLPVKEVKDISFCNVTVTYTHPGTNDKTSVMTWLPLEPESWNGRFLGTGGGGFVTGLASIYLPMAVSLGYAAASTDGGHSRDEDYPIVDWAMLSAGNLDWNLLQNFAARGLNDMTIIGKAITQNYFKKPPSYSYWYGCSTGGRQGMMHAQRFPGNYDGIVSLAPAINFADFSIAAYWSQLVMDRMGVYPTPCEMEAVTSAALEACDDMDGLVDGIVSQPGLCDFDPYTAIGKSYVCSDGNPTAITNDAAAIALATWTGAKSTAGKPLWFGLNRGTPLDVWAATKCSADGSCVGYPFYPNSDWISVFIQKNPNYDLKSITYEEFEEMIHASVHEFGSILGTNDPDLSAFRRRGGKIITWHGLADEKIPPNGTSNYYQRVLELDPNARDFYRLFEAPGVAHCGRGPGATPHDTLGTLVKWVEQGLAPEELEASQTNAQDGSKIQRNVCQYPLASRFKVGIAGATGSFVCE